MDTFIDEAIGDTQIIPDGEDCWILPPTPPLAPPLGVACATPDVVTKDVKSEAPLARAPSSKACPVTPPRGVARASPDVVTKDVKSEAPLARAPSSKACPETSARPGQLDSEALSPGATASTEQTGLIQGADAKRPNLFEMDPPMKYRGVMNMVCIKAARRCMT